MTRGKKDRLPHILIYISSIVFLIVNMNVFQMAQSYIKEISKRDSYFGYANEEFYRVKLSVEESEGYSYKKTVESVTELVGKLQKSKKDVFIETKLRLNGSDNENVQVFFSFNENPPYPLCSGEYQQTIYIGNGNEQYIDENGYIVIENEKLKVAGVINSNSIDVNYNNIIRYDAVSEKIQKKIVENLADDLMNEYIDSENRTIVIGLVSDNELKEEEKQYISLCVQKTSGLTESNEVTDDNVKKKENSDRQVRNYFKKIMFTVAFIFGTINIVQVLDVYIKRKRKDIAIFRAFGRGFRSVYIEVLRELLEIVSLGAVTAIVLEIVVFVYARGYAINITLKYCIGAYIVQVLIYTVLLLVMCKISYRRKILEDMVEGK